MSKPKMSILRQKSADFLEIHHSVTFHLGWATAIACLGTLQFGFHLAELNAAGDILSCQLHKKGPYASYSDTLWAHYGFVQCIPMDGSGVAMLTTLLTIGGLLSSIITGSKTFATSMGRKHNCLINAFMFTVGSLAMALANSSLTIGIGRFLCGLAAGSSVVISPILVSELTPVNHRGFLGSFLQLSLAIGILMSQAVSIFWSNSQQWRNIFIAAALIGFAQFVLLFTVSESPKWLVFHRDDTDSATVILSSLRSNKRTVRHEINHWRRLSQTHTPPSEPAEHTPLMEDLTADWTPLSTTMSRRGSIDPSHLSFWEYFTGYKYRRELIATVIIMSANQLCGMNAITFYGASILSKVFPPDTNIVYLTCALSLCNALSATLATPLFDIFGRKPLMLTSLGVMAVASFLISVGLSNDYPILTAATCFVFIFGYSIGIGPIVYLMVPEFTDHEAIGLGQSFGTVINWLSNISIAFFFPKLQDLLHGKVFYIFFVVCAVYAIAIVLFVPETRGLNTYSEVWDNHYKGE